MDLVSFDTPGEFAMFAEIMNRGGLKQHRRTSVILAVPSSTRPTTHFPCGFYSIGGEVEIWNENSLGQYL